MSLPATNPNAGMIDELKGALEAIRAKHYTAKSVNSALDEDLQLCGDTLLETDMQRRIDAHGLDKESLPRQIEGLVKLLDEGIDTRRDFHSAPLVVPQELRAALGAGLGTGGGSCNKHGAFIIISDPGKMLRGNSKEGHGIKAVLINPVLGEMKPALEKCFPHMQFLTFDKINDYLFSIHAIDDETRRAGNARIAEGMAALAPLIPSLPGPEKTAVPNTVKELAQQAWVIGTYNGKSGKQLSMSITGSTAEMQAVEQQLAAAGLKKNQGFSNNSGKRIMVMGSNVQEMVEQIATEKGIDTAAMLRVR